MTATDELRKLLDERGVEWEADDRKTYTFTYWGDWAFTEPLDAKPGTLGAQCELMCIPATPEQAIAATLGNKTTTRHGKFKTKYGRKVPLCECCGYSIGDDRYNYCPKCGAKVVRR